MSDLQQRYIKAVEAFIEILDVYSSPIISFEGMDNQGKSTISRELEQSLSGYGYDTALLRAPGSTPMGEKIRSLVKDINLERTPETELLLFMAAQTQQAKEIQRLSEEGCIVILDRFMDSTYVYQRKTLNKERRTMIDSFIPEEALPQVVVILQGNPSPRQISLNDKFDAASETEQQELQEAWDSYESPHAITLRVNVSTNITETLCDVIEQLTSAFNSLLHWEAPTSLN